MLNTLTIRHWENRISDELDDPIKFNKVMQDLYDIALEDATRSLGIGDDEYLCIKELAVPVQMNLSRSVRSLARDWSSAFKTQLKQHLQTKDGVIKHYPTLQHAHLHCARGVLTGDTQDLWAWQQCGLLPKEACNQPQDSILDMWCQQSSRRKYYQIPIWTHLIHSPLLMFAIKRFNHRNWHQHLTGLEQAFNHSFKNLLSVVSQYSDQWADQILQNIPNKTLGVGTVDDNLHHAILSGTADLGIWHDLALNFRSLIPLIFVIMSVIKEPGLIKLPKSLIEKRVLDIMGKDSEGRNFKDNFKDTHCKKIDSKSTKQTVKNHQHKEIKSTISTNQNAFSEFNGSVTSDQLDRIIEKKAVDELDHTGSVKRVELTIDYDVNLDPRESLELTQFGGIFYLYNLFIKEPEPLDALLSDLSLSHRSQNWVWLWMVYPLIVSGSKINAMNPHFRVLAPLFAGISEAYPGGTGVSPNAQRSALDQLFEQTPSDTEFVLLQEFAKSTMARFSELVTPDAANTEAWFRKLIRRRARVMVRGPWMEVEYSLQDVDIDVRRAGLDADPEFVQWVGMVVRFHYA